MNGAMSFYGYAQQIQLQAYEVGKLTFQEADMKDKACVISQLLVNSEQLSPPNNIFQLQKEFQKLGCVHLQHP